MTEPTIRSRDADEPRLRAGGLQTRIFLTFGLIVIGLVAVSVTLLVHNQSDSLLRETRRRGFAVARSIAMLSTPSLVSYNYIALNQAARRAQAGSDIAFVVIYDKEGRIAGDSRAENVFGQPPRNAIDRAAHRATSERWRFLTATERGPHRLLEIVVPVHVDGSDVKWGTIRVGLSLDAVDRDIATLSRNLVLAGLLAAILCLIGARIAAGSITRPLARLVSATRAMASGDYSQRLDLESGDELESLAWHFDRMADEVERRRSELLASREDLARLNQHLEATVEARTHALAESEAKYRLVVESSPQGTLIVRSGRPMFVNAAIQTMSGRTETELLDPGFEPLSLFDPAGAEEIRGLLSRGEAGSRRVNAEIAHPDGRRIRVEVQVAPLLFQNEPATMILLTDVTGLRELQERLAHAEKLRALGELAAGVAHDFNNNLGIILGRTQLIMMRTTDPTVLSGLNVIRQAAMDGGDVVRRIQQFTRVREDRALEPIDLAALAEEVVEITRSKWKDEAQRRGVKVEVRLEVASPQPIEGSRAEIREALTNLVFNAVDALPRGGTIQVRCRSEGAESILEVADDGVGMSDDVRERIFEPFFTTKGVSGNGLGLSMVYGIVSRHGGTVEVQTEPGHGTKIQMRFRASDGAVEVARAAPVVWSARPAQILVVDDEPEIREVLRDALEFVGHHVTMASSGLEGIARFRSGSFDAVLSDLGMPDVSGWEVVRVVRSEGGPATVVALVTGWGTTITDDVLRAHGVNFVVSKPFDIEGMISRLHQAFRDQAAAAA